MRRILIAFVLGDEPSLGVRGSWEGGSFVAAFVVGKGGDLGEFRGYNRHDPKTDILPRSTDVPHASTGSLSLCPRVNIKSSEFFCRNSHKSPMLLPGASVKTAEKHC